MAFRISLDQKSGLPFYRQIGNQISYAVANGLLAPGEQLPTVRQLAVDLNVNLNTVSKAYKELEIRGLVDTHQGTGTFIRGDLCESPPQEREAHLREHCLAFADEISSHGFGMAEAIDTLHRIEKERGTSRAPSKEKK